jgi:hypothetical protein
MWYVFPIKTSSSPVLTLLISVNGNNRYNNNIKNNTKFKKGLVKRTRDYIDSQDKNRVWKDNSMSRNMISSTVTSRLNMISDRRNEILSKQREASQALIQLDIQYNDLYRKCRQMINWLKMILKLERK